MSQRLTKLISLFISFCLIFEQSAFAQSIDFSHYFANSAKSILPSDKFRPLHLRYLGYDNLNNDFKILLDKGDTKKEDLDNKNYIEENTQTLLKYFFIGLALPNEKFWVNLRPDSPDNILDSDLEKTDIGRIFLEADLQLKKDTSSFTSPQTPEGKAYWDKLYQKAGELFGTENITIPTITRPWIVPNEIIIREAPDNAYIYKATLKVMLEEDYLTEHTPAVRVPHRGGAKGVYHFSDPRLKELNEYSTQLIKELIIPKLTYQVNTAKRYAPLRQVYYSLILAQWFKQKYKKETGSQSIETRENPYIKLIDSGDLTNLVSKEPYDKQTYFKQYQKSFAEGEYNLQEPVYTPMGQSIIRYMSGGIKNFMSSSAVSVSSKKEDVNIVSEYLTPIRHSKITLPRGEEFWGRIREELRNMEISGKRKYFIDTDRPIDDDVIHGGKKKTSRLVRLSYNLRDKPKIIDGGGMLLSQGYDIVQIEDIFFIDQEVHKSLSESLRKDLGNKAIVVPGLSQSTLGQSEQEGGRMQKFTAAAILSLLHSKIAGKCVIDAGAGDGMLALAAARLGASQVILIDNNKKELDKARKNLESNGLKEKENFWVMAGDLRDMPGIIEQLPAIKSAIVLVSNIGNWEEYQDGRGRVTNLTSLEFALRIAKKRKVIVSEIILGGYLAEIPELIKYSYEIEQYDEYKKHWPDNDIEILTKKGFKVRPEKSYVRECVSISFVSSAVEDSRKLHFEGFGNKAYPEILKQVIDLLQEESKKIEKTAQELGFFEKYTAFKKRKLEESELNIFLRDLEEFRNEINISFSDLTVNFLGGQTPINYDLKDKLEKAIFSLSLMIQNGITPVTPRILEKKEYFVKKMDAYIKLLSDIQNPGKIDDKTVEAMDVSDPPPESMGLPQLTHRLLLEYKKSLRNKNFQVSSSINIDKTGGIDFHALPIQIESVASSVLGVFPAAHAFKGDMDAEWTQIQQIFNAGIRPSIQRLSEYTAAAASSSLASKRVDEVRAMLADILRRDEEYEKLSAAEPVLKELIAALEL
ncbi:MAG: 50S ribosomal protein L11 methyltransferase [Candidatus Omnitrophota bacterium]|nr:50S ribosomal protein L11 methyltransferase [Candidatus Omnitrophota bacterium]